MTQQEVQKLFDFLKQNNLLTGDQYKDLNSKKYSTFEELEKYLRRTILISDEDWVRARGVFYDIEYSNLIGAKLESDILNILPQNLSENYQMVIFNKEGANIKVGLVDPTNFKAIEALNYLARKKNFQVKYLNTEILI